LKYLLTSIFILIIYSTIAQRSVPANLIYNSYYGGNEADEARSITLDKDDSFYIFGYTLSSDLPTSSNSFQDSLKGSYDAFIAKFDSSGNHIWSTYIGGSNVDIASSIKTTFDNHLILVGYSNSSDFPTTTGAFQINNAGQYDVFIIKMDTSGQIIWSTLFGGMGGELGIDASIDLNNNIIVGGQTNSSNFPYTTGAFQPLPLGGNDAFVAKFNPSGQLLWATCYGGTSTEDAHAITSDYENNVIITGMSNSNDLTVSTNALQTFNNGFFDIYIAKFSANGNFIWGTYFGGTNYDDVYGIHCDSLNNLYLAGRTASVDFETTANAFQTTKNNGIDACIFKLSTDGNLIWSTYLGGDGDDFADRIYVDKNNNVTTLINTISDTLSLIADTIFTNYPLNFEKVYIATLDSSGTPIWTSYFGGGNIDKAYDFKIASGGKLFFTGTSQSTNLPTTNNAYQSNINTYIDSYIGIIESTLFFTDTTSLNSSINHLNNTFDIFIYPNPVNEYFCIKELDDDFEIRIISAKGEILMNKKSSENCTEIKNLAPGLYIAEISKDGNIIRKKIIKY
jgi:hypothetical protein